MSKRGQETQGGEERYGFSNGASDNMDRPQQANAAQMARRKIAQVKKSGASARSSRANTPTGNPFAPQQQSMPSFQLPQQGGGDGAGFNFSVNAPSNPFQNANGAAGTPPPPSFGMNQQQQNGGGGMFGNNNGGNAGFGGSHSTSNAQSNGFGFGGSTNGNSTPSFGGGFGQSTQNQGQQNGTTPSSNTPSFSFGPANGNSGSTFQFGQSQPQKQSTQATSFGGFGQSTQTNGDKPANSFGGFGQSTQQQEKPATPSFRFGQTTQQQDNPAVPSFGFGQSTAQAVEKPATPSLGLFGSNSTAPQPANGEKAPIFGAAKQQSEQTPKPAAGSLFTFDSSNKGIGDKSTPEPAAKPSEAPKPPMSNLFGAQPTTGTSLFGPTPPPRESSATPKPGDSVFSTQSKPKLGGNLFTSDMAEGKKPEAPAPMFGQPAQPKPQAAPDAEQTPKPSNLFGGFGQPQSNAVQDTPKPSSNLFSASSFGQTPAPAAAAPKNIFGQSLQDTSMNTPGSTPQKSSLFAPSTAQHTTAPAAPSTLAETPAAGRSLFDRITRDEDPPATTEKASTPKPSVSFAPTPAADTAHKPLFPAPQAAASSNMFGKPFDKTLAPPASKAPSISSQAALPQAPTASQSGRSSSIPHAACTMADVIPENEKKTLKVLNEGLMAHLARQDPNADWTMVMEYYLKQAANMRGKPAPNFAALSAPPPARTTTDQSMERPATRSQSRKSDDASRAQQSAPFGQSKPAAEAPKNIFGSSEAPKTLFGFGSSSAATPKAPSFQRTSSGDSQQTPKPSFFQPPSTAPVNRKRSAEDDAERPPATEKRAKASDSIQYPKLPDNASEVSKMFFNALENKTSDASQKSQDAAPNVSGSRTVGALQVLPNTPSGSGFTPGTSGFKPSTAGFKPSSSGFTPSAPSGGSSSFLAAFGKKASEQEEKDRQKRRDDDYDSEEETEEQWAERDRKEQEAKRTKSLEAAKASTGFVFNPTPAPAAKETSSETGPSKSLFDRVSKPAPTPSDKPSLFSPQTAAPKTAPVSTGTSLFGHLAKPASNETPKAPDAADKGEDVEKETQGTGDKSWNPNTPIKFGTGSTANGSTTPAAAPPTFGNLFGPTAQPSSSDKPGLLGVPSAKPAMGFSFGAQAATGSGSRATTPGVTTDGEGTGASASGDADNEPSDDPPASEAQVEDMTGLTADETKGETVLHTVPMSKASKWGEKKDTEGGSGHGWVDRGKGPLYLLKNDETGKVRILLKVPPYGSAKMNFPPLKGGGYEVQGKTGKQITGTFYDHMADKPGLGKWLIAVGKKEDAEEVSRILKENQPE